MHNLLVTIRRYIDDSQPGWVECNFRDAWGHEHRFREKVPVVSVESLDASSTYPRPGIIACEITVRWKDESGRDLFKISTEKPWGCESIDGATSFDVLPDQLTTEPDGAADAAPPHR
jgi:hypothetical protein